MRVLSVCTSTNIFGAETITLKMLEGFKLAGHKQLAVTTVWTDGEFSRRLTNIGIDEVRLPFGAWSKRLAWEPMWWTANTLVRIPWLWAGWLRVVRAFRPDVIVWTSSRLPVPVYPLIGSCPSFMIEYTNLEPTKTRRVIYDLLARKLTGFVAVSDFMAEHLHDVGAPRTKIRVIKSGTFFERERHSTEQICASFVPNTNGPFRIGFVGQVAPNKGLDCLVAAVRLLRDRGTTLAVKVFGSGDLAYVNELKAKIAEANLTEIWNWMGYEWDKAKIFGSMDICVVPSCFGDPFPTVAMEAGVYGLPVVASHIGGLPEIIEDGVTGWLVEPNSPAPMAEKIQWLIEHPDRGRAMGAAGRAKVFQQFTVEKMVAEFETLFKAVTVRTH